MLSAANSPRNQSTAIIHDQTIEAEKDEPVGQNGVSARLLGEQIINNTAPTKSKSLTQSQLGGQESENIRRLQEALQTKKEINNELNQKLINLETE